MNKFSIQPSVICSDLCNLETEVKALEQAGVQSLHIDVLDGAFAPSLPVGIDTFIQLSKKTSLPFDVHIMSNNNDWFIDKCVEMNPERICFQIESEEDPKGKLEKIKAHGIKAGLAISPETPLDEKLLKECDFILLMRIKPGYASYQVEISPEVNKKIVEARKILGDKDIVIDGRVNLETIEELLKLGATCFVCGSKSIFASKDYKTNVEKVKEVYMKACGA